MMLIFETTTFRKFWLWFLGFLVVVVVQMSSASCQFHVFTAPLETPVLLIGLNSFLVWLRRVEYSTYEFDTPLREKVNLYKMNLGQRNYHKSYHVKKNKYLYGCFQK